MTRLTVSGPGLDTSLAPNDGQSGRRYLPSAARHSGFAPGGFAPGGGAPPAGTAAGIGELLGTLLRQRWLVVGSAVAGLALAGAYLARAVPIYEASAALRIDDRQAPTPEVIRTLPSTDEVATELDVLRSHTLAAEVVDSLGLQVGVAAPRRARRSSVLSAARVVRDDSATLVATRTAAGRFVVRHGGGAAVVPVGAPTLVAGVWLTLAPDAAKLPTFTLRVRPRDAAADALLRRMVINRSGAKANLIVLRLRDADPATARDVVNVWARAYMAQRNTAQKSEARSTAAFLRAQIDTINNELAASEGTLRAYRERENVVDPQVEASTELSRLSSTTLERDQLDAERRALAEIVAEVRASGAPHGEGEPSPYRRLVGFPTLLRNQTTSELLRSLTQVEDQRSELLQRRSPRDGDVQQLTARQRVLEQQLRAVAETYLQGLTAQVAALDDALGRVGSSLRRVPEREEQLTRLRRTPRVLESLVTMLQTRLKEAQIAQAVEDPSVRLVDAGVLPWKPAAPRAPLVLGFGLFAGICVGVSVAFAREYRTRRLRTRDDVRAVTALPIIGLVPRFESAPARLLRSGGAVIERRPRLRLLGAASRTRGADDDATGRAVADAIFQRLFVNAAYAGANGAPRSLVVTSPLPGDGKSTTAAMLACTLARSGRRVLLVDADLRRGSLCALLGVEPGVGLADVLGGSHTLAETVVRVPVGDPDVLLDVVGPGSGGGRAGAFVLGGDWHSVIRAAEQAYDVVIVDVPPVNIVADAAVLATHADGVLLVARAGITTGPILEFAVEQLERVRASVLGVVLNDFDLDADASYGGSHQYLVQAYYADASRSGAG